MIFQKDPCIVDSARHQINLPTGCIASIPVSRDIMTVDLNEYVPKVFSVRTVDSLLEA